MNNIVISVVGLLRELFIPLFLWFKSSANTKNKIKADSMEKSNEVNNTAIDGIVNPDRVRNKAKNLGEEPSND